MRLAAGPRFGVDGAFERYLRLPTRCPTPVLEDAVARLAVAWRSVTESAPPTVPARARARRVTHASVAGTLRRSRVAQVMDFHALFDAQYVPVYRYLAHRLGDRAAAEDLAAETFLRAYAARASFRPGSPRAWLFTIATNLLRDHARGAGRRDAAFASGRAAPARRRARVRAPRPAARAGPGGPARARSARRCCSTPGPSSPTRRSPPSPASPSAPSAPASPAPARGSTAELAPREEPEMTVDDRLRAAHARIPEPDEATVARARARARGDAARRRRRGGARVARRHRGAAVRAVAVRAPRRASPRRQAAARSALAALALAAIAAIAVLPRDVGAPAACEPADAGRRCFYQRNTFHAEHAVHRRGRAPGGDPRRRGYAIARSVPEELWLAPDGSGRVVLRRARAPRTCPAPRTSGPGARPARPTSSELIGAAGRVGTEDGLRPGRARRAADLQLEPRSGPAEARPAVGAPAEPRELREFLRAAAEQAAPGQHRRAHPRHVRRRRVDVPALPADAARPARGADRGLRDLPARARSVRSRDPRAGRVAARPSSPATWTAAR